MDYEIEFGKAKCLECGEVIEYGRQGKKFCCDNCKNKFNNRRSQSSRKIRMKILSALDRNYTILENLLRINVTSISVVELQGLGFKLDYVTSYQKIRRHDVFLCYDISFTLISDRITAISKLSVNLPFIPIGGSGSVRLLRADENGKITD